MQNISKIIFFKLVVLMSIQSIQVRGGAKLISKLLIFARLNFTERIIINKSTSPVYDKNSKSLQNKAILFALLSFRFLLLDFSKVLQMPSKRAYFGVNFLNISRICGRLQPRKNNKHLFSFSRVLHNPHFLEFSVHLM